MQATTCHPAHATLLPASCPKSNQPQMHPTRANQKRIGITRLTKSDQGQPKKRRDCPTQRGFLPDNHGGRLAGKSSVTGARIVPNMTVNSWGTNLGKVLCVPQAQVVTINSMGLRQLERTERNTRMRHKDKTNEPVNGGFNSRLFQVSGEGLSYAQLDRAAGESTKREEDPDPQPGRGNDVRVSGWSPHPSPLLCTHRH